MNTIEDMHEVHPFPWIVMPKGGIRDATGLIVFSDEEYSAWMRHKIVEILNADWERLRNRS